MKHQSNGSRLRAAVVVIASVAATIATPALFARSTVELGMTRAGSDSAARANVAGLSATEHDSIYGRSGKRLFGLVDLGHRLEIGVLKRLFGDSALRAPGVYAASAVAQPFSLIAMLPFSSKVGGRIGTYSIGYWPAEKGNRARSASYANPRGFIEVTRENQDTPVSAHFRLADFLTHDQQDVWPKYLVLREELVDKLELVIDELEGSGTPVRHMQVMSGFRTPQYNEEGGDPRGRASASRHQYGDAADVFVDNDGDGRMDDLNHDGRVDGRDAAVILAAAERVERRNGDLVGGVGVYRATVAHGPFAHIDVRGTRARWGNT